MKHIGSIIKVLREKKEMTQQQIAELIHMHRSNYSKVEKGERDLSLQAIQRIAQHFGLTIDQIVNFQGNIPHEVTLEDKSLIEKIKLIQELETEEKSMVLKLIETFVAKKRFKEYLQKHMANL